MPNKYAESKGWNVPKQKHRVKNWSEYNKSLKSRGRIEVWLSDDAINLWYEKDTKYDGTGRPKVFSDFAIIICHEIRQVYRLPLRQCQGFIDSLFEIGNIPLKAPDYTCLSKRLSSLNIKSPRYKRTQKPDASIEAIAIDSTGLKRFGRNEWHQEKHKVSAKRSWRKLHIAVDDKHYIHAVELTDRFISDTEIAEELIDQIDTTIEHFSADKAYDSNKIYELLHEKYPDIIIAIPTKKNAVCGRSNHDARNATLMLRNHVGMMQWQKIMEYGRRNKSELCIERYKVILGNKMHAREMSRQKQESIIGCGILNKMTSLGVPESYRIA